MSDDINDEYPNGECFIIMPISDPDGYKLGHFQKVYEDIFTVACKNAGYRAVRGDDVKQTNMIHLDILEKLLNSPMAICDLSSRNPNVMFELGFRQAFDKPTVLVEELGTQKIFDISPIRVESYSGTLEYRSVKEDQIKIQKVIEATHSAADSGQGINSLVRLLELSTPAMLKEIKNNPTAEMMQIIMNEIKNLKTDVRSSLRKSNYLSNDELTSHVNTLEQLASQYREGLEQKMDYKDIISIVLRIKNKILYLRGQMLPEKLIKTIDLLEANITKKLQEFYPAQFDFEDDLK